MKQHILERVWPIIKKKRWLLSSYMSFYKLLWWLPRKTTGHLSFLKYSFTQIKLPLAGGRCWQAFPRLSRIWDPELEDSRTGLRTGGPELEPLDNSGATPANGECWKDSQVIKLANRRETPNTVISNYSQTCCFKIHIVGLIVSLKKFFH
jgi:hypothetical protein